MVEPTAQQDMGENDSFDSDEPLPGPKLKVNVKHIYPESRPFGEPVVRDENQVEASSDSDVDADQNA